MARIREQRRGNIVTLTALMLVPIMAIIGLAIELGVIYVNQAELQRAADASAMAAAWELIAVKYSDDNIESSEWAKRAKKTAKEYAIANCSRQQLTQFNDEDIEIGYLEHPVTGSLLETNDPDLFNAARVHVRRDGQANGPVRLLFAAMIGKETVNMSASATAAVIFNIRGFKSPTSMLPFALDLNTWTEIENGIGEDNWFWDPATEQFYPGNDGIIEFNFYPQNTGSTANAGTLNIGGNENSTSRIARQILNGISAEDLEFHGGELAIESSGELMLGGDPGISAGFQDEFNEIIGQSRILPIFGDASGDGGNNQQYTVVKWVGVKIIDVKLTGRNKYIIAQAAPVMVSGAIQNPDDDNSSQNLFSPVWLAE